MTGNPNILEAVQRVDEALPRTAAAHTDVSADIRLGIERTLLLQEELARRVGGLATGNTNVNHMPSGDELLARERMSFERLGYKPPAAAHAYVNDDADEATDIIVR